MRQYLSVQRWIRGARLLDMRLAAPGRPSRDGERDGRRWRLAALRTFVWTTPFGSLAIPEGPIALRPTLADGLPLSWYTAVVALCRLKRRLRGWACQTGRL